MKKRWLLLAGAALVAAIAVALWPTRRPGGEAPADPASPPVAIDPVLAVLASDAGPAPEPVEEEEEDAAEPEPAWLTGEVTDENGGVPQALVEISRRSDADGCAPQATTHSVAGGSFEAGPLCSGQYDVRASRDGRWASAVARLEDGERARVALRLRAGTRLEVKVRDEKRAPVAGAAVQVQDDTSGYLARGVTDAQGAASFDGLAPRPHTVTADKEGHLRASRERTLAVARDAIELLLPNGAALEGRVVGPEGEGVADVQLRLGTRSKRLNGGLVPEHHFHSGDGGYFGIGPMRPGAYVLSAKHPGYRRAVKDVKVPGPAPTLVLARGARLDGVFLDVDGQPVPWADINGQSKDEAEKIDPDYDGGFHAEGLANGEWTLVGHAKGADGGSLGIAVTKFTVKDEPAISVTLELERGEFIEGRCVEAPGGAPATTGVIAVEEKVFKRLMLSGMAMSSAEPGLLSVAECPGRFRVEGLKAGRYRLVACGNHEDPPTAATGARDAVVTCEAAGLVTYRVVDEQRRPVTRYANWGSPEDHEDGRTQRTFRGTFDEVITIRAPGFAPLQRHVTAARSEHKDLGDLVLTRARTLKGIARGAGRAPLEGSVVTYGLATDALAQTRTGADGTFELADLPSEAGTVFAAHPDHLPTERAVSAGEAMVELVLMPARRIRGAIVTRDGRAPAGLRVAARRTGMPDARSGEAADGTYEIPAVPDGEVFLRVESTLPGQRVSGFTPLRTAESNVDFVERIGGANVFVAPFDDEGQPVDADVSLVPGTAAYATDADARRDVALRGLESDAEQGLHGFAAVPPGKWTAVLFLRNAKGRFWVAPVDVGPTTGVVRLAMPRGVY